MTPKQLRTIELESRRLFKVESWLPHDELRALGMERLVREVRHDSKHLGYLSANGITHFEKIVSIIDAAGEFDGTASYADIYTACKETLAKFIAQGLMPETADEFLTPVRERVQKQVCPRTFVVSMYGVQLKELETVDVGRFRLTRPSPEILAASGISDKSGRIPSLIEQMGERQVWFMGSINATDKVAKKEFFHHARLTAGLFAVYAASTFEYGAHSFRIGAVASPEEARVPASIYLSWEEGSGFLGYTRQWRQGQEYEIDSKLVNKLQVDPIFLKMLEILQKPDPNKLEVAIVRAVYWFADAHKDSAEVMRFIKFWSCIESFFSEKKGDITKSVSIGTAAILAFGKLEFKSESSYLATRKRLAALYDKRSKAVHEGMHNHIEEKDLADLSQWAAWLILSMAEMSNRYTDAQHILEKCIDLDKKASGSGTA
jgi:Apea-like HEPN